MTTRKAIWFFVSLAAITAAAIILSRPAHAGKVHGSSNVTGALYATETDRIIVGAHSIFGGGNPQFQIQDAAAQPNLSLYAFNGVAAPALNLGVSSGALGAYGLPATCCGGVYWKGNDGSSEVTLGQVSMALSATATAGSIPTKLLFYTTPVGGTAGTLKGALDATGRWLLNGVGTVPSIGGQNPHLYVSGLTGDMGTFAVTRSTADSSPAKLLCGKTRATSDGTLTTITSGDDLCQIGAYAADGSAYALSSYILFDTTGTIASGTAPGVMKFFTATASGTATQALQIDQTQMVTLSAGLKLGAASTPSSSSEACTTGEFRWDASYLYVCTATNTWKRVALEAF